jgi:hypothetical protein
MLDEGICSVFAYDLQPSVLTKRIELSAVRIFCGDNELDARALSAAFFFSRAYAIDRGIVARKKISIFIVFHQSSAFPW